MKIAVVGKMRSGKDTLGRYFIDNEGCFKMAFGDAIKKIAHEYFPELVEQGKPRKLYQKIGQEFRKFDPEVWVKALARDKAFLESAGIENYIITDVRQINEYEYLKKEGFTVIKVEAIDETRKERIMLSGDVFEAEDFYHETETTVDLIPYDYLITNNDTLESFMEQVNFVYEELKGEAKNGKR